MTTPKKRSRKLYILWAIALTLLLTAALFCWLVVVPVWRVRAVLTLMPTKNYGPLITKLGGEHAAATELYEYLRRPDWQAPSKRKALDLMSNVSSGREAIADAPLDRDLLLEVRLEVIRYLGTEPDSSMDDEEWRARALERAAREADDPEIRQAAREALKKIKAAQEKK